MTARGEADKKGEQRGEERKGNARDKPADGLTKRRFIDARARDRYLPRQRSHWTLLLLLHPVAPVSRYKPIESQSRGLRLREGEPAEAQACLARSTPPHSRLDKREHARTTMRLYDYVVVWNMDAPHRYQLNSSSAYRLLCITPCRRSTLDQPPARDIIKWAEVGGERYTKAWGCCCSHLFQRSVI